MCRFFMGRHIYTLNIRLATGAGCFVVYTLVAFHEGGNDKTQVFCLNRGLYRALFRQ